MRTSPRASLAARSGAWLPLALACVLWPGSALASDRVVRSTCVVPEASDAQLLDLANQTLWDAPGVHRQAARIDWIVLTCHEDRVEVIVRGVTRVRLDPAPSGRAEVPRSGRAAWPAVEQAIRNAAEAYAGALTGRSPWRDGADGAGLYRLGYAVVAGLGTLNDQGGSVDLVAKAPGHFLRFALGGGVGDAGWSAGTVLTCGMRLSPGNYLFVQQAAGALAWWGGADADPGRAGWGPYVFLISGMGWGMQLARTVALETGLHLHLGGVIDGPPALPHAAPGLSLALVWSPGSRHERRPTP